MVTETPPSEVGNWPSTKSVPAKRPVKPVYVKQFVGGAFLAALVVVGLLQPPRRSRR